MKRIVILYGGKSGEHEVSKISAASVVKNLDPAVYEPILVGITKQGLFRLQNPSLAQRARDGLTPLPVEEGARVLASPDEGFFVEEGGAFKALPCDAVFPVLHGTFGEDGTIQGLLETAGLPYVGAPVLGSALGMDKEKAKALWAEAGLPIVPYVLVRARGFEAEPETAAAEVASRLGYPCFVKPVCAGSSVGASKVASPAALGKALKEAFAWDDKVLVEPFIEAREIECAVFGNTGGKTAPKAFAPGEVAPTHEFYDYDAKYLDPDGARLEIPAKISAGQAAEVRRIALAAYAALDLAGMSRVDFFLDKRDGKIYLNEVNTIPGFTSISMYPKMCELGGLSYRDLLSGLIALALERADSRRSLSFNA
jgi:D-alanine-D-alanine ligase